MINPIQHLFHRRTDAAGRQAGPVDQDHWQTQHAGRIEFRARATAAGVLCHDHPDPVFTQQRSVGLDIKGTAGDDRLCTWHWQRGLGWVNEAQQVKMLGPRGKGGKVLLADGQKDPRRCLGQRSAGCSEIGRMGPAIPLPGLPRWPFERTKNGAGAGAGGNRVGAHLGGKWMGRVDHMGDRLSRKIGLQPLDPAKAADAGGQWLGLGRAGAAGIGKHRVIAARGKSGGKGAGLGRAAQKQDACHG